MQRGGEKQSDEELSLHGCYMLSLRCSLDSSEIRSYVMSLDICLLGVRPALNFNAAAEKHIAI